MAQVTSIHGVRLFSLEEAQDLLPVVRRITNELSVVADQLMECLDSMEVIDDQKTSDIEERVNSIILQWQTKMNKLGLLPRGLWSVEFPAERGHYFWSYPQPRLEYRLEGSSREAEGAVLQTMDVETAEALD